MKAGRGTEKKIFNNMVFMYMILLLLFLAIAGCSSVSDSSSMSAEGTVEKESEREDSAGETENRITADPVTIAELYRDLYEQAVQQQTLGNLEMFQAVVSRLGEHGYAAVDAENENQVNMTHPELLEQFCGLVEEKKEGCVTFLCIMQNGGFVRFDLETSQGQVMVTRSVLTWVGGEPEVSYVHQYPAEGWRYSENGYLFFEEALPEGYDGAPGYTAVRVQPLEETCREFNRKYILPVNYGSNNMFLTDWSEPDFRGIEFDDLFALLYPYAMGTPMPYEKSVEGERYMVPEEEYEKVICSYFSIDKDTLRAQAAYSQQEKGYDYRTRGFYDNAASPNLPYPEVVSYEEKEDGTVTLTVNAVWPQKLMERTFSHEVTVRPDEKGGFRYISNYVTFFAENVEPEWYTEKFTDEEWNAIYGGEDES